MTTIQPKIPGGISNGTEIPGKKFSKFGYTSQGCPFFPEIPEHTIPLATGNFRKFKRNFLVERKAHTVLIRNRPGKTRNNSLRQN